jgi:hypothetical protein
MYPNYDNLDVLRLDAGFPGFVPFSTTEIPVD